MAADRSGEFERAFGGAAQYALDTGFTKILELKPVQEALLHFVKREDVFAMLPTGVDVGNVQSQLVLKVCEYMHDQGFGYPQCCHFNFYLSVKRSN